ncbi:uncharacterized protein Bfra_010541 [Botrytis fragariae]|uniref:Uncharacterized protein n=1 Tax=Botrytis fragariae TaxID=1964551 RepID=A0A8H6AG43_9HELO|nr:uncharacterized protein Bfra_010541 [Botrytis fragariae]KAF5867566.1 hypothetical protein Bfra_010541 [Botrytis fragariae]
MARLLVNRSGIQKTFGDEDLAILENQVMAIKDPIREIRIGGMLLDRSRRANKLNELDFIMVAH